MSQADLVVTAEDVDGARDLSLAFMHAAIALQESLTITDANPLVSGGLAFGCLFVATCRDLNVNPVEFLKVAQEALSSPAKIITRIH